PGIATGQVIDIGKSNVNIPYTGASILPAVQSALKSGYNNGAWNGTTGILSSDAAASAGKFGVADVDNGVVRLSYRVIGDLNTDGSVNFTDLLALAQHYNNTGVDWSKGDLNYDGTVNFSDLLALAQHYNNTAGSAAS